MREEDEGGNGRRGEWVKRSSFLVYRLSGRVAGSSCRVQDAGCKLTCNMQPGTCNLQHTTLFRQCTIHKSDLLTLSIGLKPFQDVFICRKYFNCNIILFYFRFFFISQYCTSFKLQILAGINKSAGFPFVSI